MTAQAGSTLTATTAELRQLRLELRARRRELTGPARASADRAIVAAIRHLPEFRHARRIAVFLPFDGEPAIDALFAAAQRSGKRLYAPVLQGLRMTFAELAADARLATNFFGILEPKLGEPIDARMLDLVLTPLVGFDSHGVRLGVGRGYYDRCFRFLAHRSRWRRPKLLGVAYELQRLPPLAARPWDIPLWGVATEAGVQRF